MVPVVSAEDGQWLLPEPLAPMMKPGGHGAIWKLMLDRGVFEYFSQRRRKAAIVRQIRCRTPILPLLIFPWDFNRPVICSVSRDMRVAARSI